MTFPSLPPPKSARTVAGLRITVYTLAAGWLYSMGSGEVTLEMALAGSGLIVLVAALTRQW